MHTSSRSTMDGGKFRPILAGSGGSDGLHNRLTQEVLP